MKDSFEFAVTTALAMRDLGNRSALQTLILAMAFFEASSGEAFMIESEVFYGSSLQSIMIPNNVEIFGSNCFSYCKSRSSITIESNSHLTRIEWFAFSESSLQSISIPSRILFIPAKAVHIGLQLELIDGDSCTEFDQWLQLKRSRIAVDFRRIRKVGFDVPCLRDYLVNLSGI
jgi:hypothetical protein